MGFFDSVLEETPKTLDPVVTAKKDEQDGSFLIINDAPITTEDIPDTAIQFFDSTPTTPESTVSFFADPILGNEEISMSVASETTEVSDAGISFFTEENQESSKESEIIIPENITTEVANTLTPTELIFDNSSIVDPLTETTPASGAKIDTILDFIAEPNSTQESAQIKSQEEAPVIVKDDIYEPIEKAIGEFNIMLDRHAKLATIKDSEIAEFNAQVAVAKAGAKKSLDERKALDTEMDRIKQMKELFTAQLK